MLIAVSKRKDNIRVAFHYQSSQVCKRFAYVPMSSLFRSCILVCRNSKYHIFHHSDSLRRRIDRSLSSHCTGTTFIGEVKMSCWCGPEGSKTVLYQRKVSQRHNVFELHRLHIIHGSRLC